MSEPVTQRLLTLGEVMLRLSPPAGEIMLQTSSLDVWIAGAEANVATQLALLGHEVRFVSRVPDNDLGRAAVQKLRGFGVDTSGVAVGGERMGLYFVTPGAGDRPPDVIYDRVGSAFNQATVDSWDWDVQFAGVTRLHLTGITPALGPANAELAAAVASAASERDIPISFDGNWRGSLWSRWGGDARSILSSIVQHVDLLFGNHRDIALILGKPVSSSDPRASAEAAFAAFPKLSMIASTERTIVSANRQTLSARLDARDSEQALHPFVITNSVDRIGSGDAFVAGVLSSLLDFPFQPAPIERGLALAVLKHSLKGDAGLFTRGQIEDFLSGARDVRR